MHKNSRAAWWDIKVHKRDSRRISREVYDIGISHGLVFPGGMQVARQHHRVYFKVMLASAVSFALAEQNAEIQRDERCASNNGKTAQTPTTG